MTEYSVEEVRALSCELRASGDNLPSANDCNKAADMLTAYAERIKADARPVARSEAVAWRWRRHAKDAWHYDQFDSIEDMAAQEMRAKGWDVELLFDRPPAQAAQSVDIEAIREVIESHINEAKKLRHDPESQDYLYEQADKLTAALQEKGNG